MAYKPKKTKQKPQEPTREELIKRDAMALAVLILDIYKEKKIKEQQDAVS